MEQSGVDTSRIGEGGSLVNGHSNGQSGNGIKYVYHCDYVCPVLSTYLSQIAYTQTDSPGEHTNKELYVTRMTITSTQMWMHPLPSADMRVAKLSSNKILLTREANRNRLTCVVLLFLFVNLYYYNSNNDNIRLTTLCPGLLGWAGTRKVKPIWIYWSKRQWVAVASAGPYANLHPDR